MNEKGNLGSKVPSF